MLTTPSEKHEHISGQRKKKHKSKKHLEVVHLNRMVKHDLRQALDLLVNL